jgi:hypothetical protein
MPGILQSATDVAFHSVNARLGGEQPIDQPNEKQNY